MSGTVKQDSSQLTPTPVGTRDVTLSQEGSQSLPQPGLSPVLAQYKSYLQSCYKARALAPADKYLPTLKTPYINLAMIKRGHRGSDARDEFTRRTLHGGVDQILASKTPINIEDLLVPESRMTSNDIRRAQLLHPYNWSGIGYEPNYSVLGGGWPLASEQSFATGPLHSPQFSNTGPLHMLQISDTRPFNIPQFSDTGPLHMPEFSDTGLLHNMPLMSGASEMVETDQRSDKFKKEPVSFILVEGPPGIGKSTFAWEVCRRWNEIESFRNYHTVVLLKLREKWVLNATKLSDLFRYPSDPELSAAIAKDLSETHGRNLLLVLDGFDEVSHSFHETSVIKSILCRQLLPECTIILTTRPSAKHTLESVCQLPVDKHVEIVGFTEEERVRYITEVFSKEPELEVNFLKYMFLVPHIKSMMYIPLNCALIAQVYYESQQSSHHLAIPRTRTQLYKALTHSLLVRHMKMKERNPEYSGMLPESLKKEDMEKFKVLAKFAFDSYHEGKSKKVIFFKEDIPEELVHFGFMNESTEMYAGKGVEQTFSFLHLSLQEYLAAWHLAHSYSIEFQVAYHWLAVNGSRSVFRVHLGLHQMYKGSDKEEETLISSLEPLRGSLVEPAVFLSGITGLRSQSEDDRNHWEIYFSHHTVGINDREVLLRSLYEAQNGDIIPHYFTSETSRRQTGIGSDYVNSLTTPYDCYALSYCLAHSSDQFSLDIGIRRDDDVSLVETLVKGFEDHCTSTTPSVEHLRVELNPESGEISNKTMFWLMKAKFLPAVENLKLEIQLIHVIKSDLILTFLQSLSKLQSLRLGPERFLINKQPTSLEWLAGLKSLSELRELYISIRGECSPPPAGLECGPVSSRLTTVKMDINLPSNTAYLHSSTDGMVDSLLKSVLRSNQITKLCLPNISRETMAGVHSILLHCPSLFSLELKRTRLGYDGILYICSALRNNTSLTHLLIHDDSQVPASRRRNMDIRLTSFSSMERVALPDKTTCTDFLLELNCILKDNTTLKEMDIQSGLFLPLSSHGHWEYQWTSLGPLQQFNLGAVSSGRSPNLRRSFSSSDLTQPQTLLFWDQQLGYSDNRPPEVNFKRLFSKKKKEGKKLFSLPSFTAPDTEVLQSFSGLDARLKQCLRISQLNGKYYMELWTYREMLHVLPQYMSSH